MRQPLVSVLMNCHNGEMYLREAIDSVFAQTYQNWEIIFWDNASRDVSSEIAKSYGSRIRYFYSDKLEKLHVARNRALAQCRGEFIAFLDCDDIWFPTKLEKQVQLFQKPEICLVYSKSAILKKTQRGYESHARRVISYPQGRAFDALLKHYVIHLHSAIIRREFLNQHDLKFDECLDNAGDMGLFLEIAYLGCIAFCPEVLSSWRSHGENLSYRLREKLPQELSWMLSGILSRHPEMIHKHMKSLRDFIRYVALQEAYAYFLKREYAASRRILKSNFKLDKRFIGLWALSYLPNFLLYCLLPEVKQIRQQANV